MSPRSKTELLRDEMLDCRDRLVLLRAKLYRWGVAPNARLRELEGELALAERRLRAERRRIQS